MKKITNLFEKYPNKPLAELLNDVLNVEAGHGKTVTNKRLFSLPDSKNTLTVKQKNFLLEKILQIKDDNTKWWKLTGDDNQIEITSINYGLELAGRIIMGQSPYTSGIPYTQFSLLDKEAEEKFKTEIQWI